MKDGSTEGRCNEGEFLYPGDLKDDWVCDCRPGEYFLPKSNYFPETNEIFMFHFQHTFITRRITVAMRPGPEVHVETVNIWFYRTMVLYPYVYTIFARRTMFVF